MPDERDGGQSRERTAVESLEPQMPRAESTAKRGRSRERVVARVRVVSATCRRETLAEPLLQSSRCVHSHQLATTHAWRRYLARCLESNSCASSKVASMIQTCEPSRAAPSNETAHERACCPSRSHRQCTNTAAITRHTILDQITLHCAWFE